MSYALVSDATLDLPMDLVEKYHIEVIPMAFNLDGKEILHYPDERNLTLENFYLALNNGSTSSTSQINPASYVEFLTPLLKKGEDIFYMGLTSGLSGTYQSALIARDMLCEDFPERKIYIIDNSCASAGLGYLWHLVAQKKEEGYDIDELKEWVEANEKRVAHWFVVGNLFHLQRGGRLSFAEAMLGSALKIKPVISVDDEGKMFVENKMRGLKKSMEYMISKINDTMDAKERSLFIAHGDNEAAALELKEKVLEKTNVTDITITKIGPVIGSHTGPGMLAVLFMEKEA